MPGIFFFNLNNAVITVQAYDANRSAEGAPHKSKVSWTENIGTPVVLYSAPMVLVSDTVDATSAKTLNAEGGVQLCPNQVFKVSGGGTLCIESIQLGTAPAIPLNKSIPAATIAKKVPVTFYVLETADDAGGTKALARVYQDIQVAQERLLQIGVQITPDVREIVPIPENYKYLKTQKTEVNELTHEKKNVVYWPKRAPPFTQDQFNLTEMLPKNSESDIVVIYVNTFLDNPLSAYPFGTAAGVSWFSLDGDGTISAAVKKRYANRILMPFNDEQIFTLAHELGHLLTRMFHFGDDYVDLENIDLPAADNRPLKQGGESNADLRVKQNLMKSPTDKINSIISTKRLYNSQQKLILDYLKKNRL